MKIFLSSNLRSRIPDYDPEKGHEEEVSKGTAVADLCRKINIPADDVAIIMVDGRMREPDYVLNGTERIYLFPFIGGG